MRLKIQGPMLAAFALLAAACGGGGSSSGQGASSDPPPAGAGKTVLVSGAISGFGSVIVNGVRYDTTGTTVSMDDQRPQNPTVRGQLSPHSTVYTVLSQKLAQPLASVTVRPSRKEPTGPASPITQRSVGPGTAWKAPLPEIDHSYFAIPSGAQNRQPVLSAQTRGRPVIAQVGPGRTVVVATYDAIGHDKLYTMTHMDARGEVIGSICFRAGMTGDYSAWSSSGDIGQMKDMYEVLLDAKGLPHRYRRGFDHLVGVMHTQHKV